LLDAYAGQGTFYLIYKKRTGSFPMIVSSARFERIPVHVTERAERASTAVAVEIAALIRQRAAEGRTCVLGLATGSTPTGVYAELVRMHKQEGLSFADVVTFNLDEYYPMRPAELQSYRRFMREHLFDHIDIKPDNTHVPDGTVPVEQVAAYCEGYERAILGRRPDRPHRVQRAGVRGRQPNPAHHVRPGHPTRRG
jgi:hypothetical protein